MERKCKWRYNAWVICAWIRCNVFSRTNTLRMGIDPGKFIEICWAYRDARKKEHRRSSLPIWRRRLAWILCCRRYWAKGNIGRLLLVVIMLERLSEISANLSDWPWWATMSIGNSILRSLGLRRKRGAMPRSWLLQGDMTVGRRSLWTSSRSTRWRRSGSILPRPNTEIPGQFVLRIGNILGSWLRTILWVLMGIRWCVLRGRSAPAS